MPPSPPPSRVLVLGLGNPLCGDDGFGPAVIARLEREGDPALWPVDGGTLGLVLVATIAEAEALVVVDAAVMGEAPGVLASGLGAEMDAMIGRRGASAHGISLADLLGAAALAGQLPERRALVCVEPECVAWGSGLSAAVEPRVEDAARLARRIAGHWRNA